jgi:acyl-[acyl carrier protein]--UDP-N-acetylglucosamine O-acyltransferase
VPGKFETMRPQKMVGHDVAEGRTAWVSVPAVDSSLGTKLLPAVLSLIAGSVDVISFLGLGGLFTAHMAILAAHVVSGGAAQLALMLSVPVFMVVFGRKEILRT